MMEPITTATIGTAIARGLLEVGQRLVHEGVVEVPLEPAKKGLDRFVQRQYDARMGEDKALRNAVKTALAEAGAPTDDEDDLRRWLKQVSLDSSRRRKTTHCAGRWRAAS
jgi:hypothetical protein